VARGWRSWLGRGLLAAVLLAVAFAPGQATSAPAASCGQTQCPPPPGTVRWTHPLPGAWSAASDLLGTVPATAYGGGQAYAAAGQSVVAVGFGMIVYAYSARTGDTLWVTGLSGFPAGSQIVSVRAWPGVVAVGVASGPLLAAGGNVQHAVILAAASGRQLRSYPAAPFGGAIIASSRSTVVVGPTAVTSYANATGKVNWSRATGNVTEDWRSDGGHVYVAQAVGGNLGTGPVTALRRISLRTGAEQILRPPGGKFVGRLSSVLRGVVLFSGVQGVSAYSATTGHPLWHRAGAVPQSVDTVRGLFYLTIGNTLTGVQPGTGQVNNRVRGASGSGSGGVYGVRDGVALGFDLGALGQVWGYDVASQRVIWNTGTLPWPHYFVDLSGIGGSADPTDSTVLLTACTQRIQAPAGEVCQDPELVLIDR
jgi:PQQ-like domain